MKWKFLKYLSYSLVLIYAFSSCKKKPAFEKGKYEVILTLNYPNDSIVTTNHIFYGPGFHQNKYHFYYAKNSASEYIYLSDDFSSIEFEFSIFNNFDVPVNGTYTSNHSTIVEKSSNFLKLSFENTNPDGLNTLNYIDGGFSLKRIDL